MKEFLDILAVVDDGLSGAPADHGDVIAKVWELYATGDWYQLQQLVDGCYIVGKMHREDSNERN